jgi:hypothetical protein
MADIGELVGSLLASLAHARRITDQETTEIAEYYRSNPLLSGMSVPRVRVPEMVVELPMLIETYSEAKPPALQTPSAITSAVFEKLSKELTSRGAPLSKSAQTTLKTALTQKLKRITPATDSAAQYVQREQVVQVVNEIFAKAVKQSRISDLDARKIAALVEEKTREVAFKDSGVPSKIHASIITADIKEKAALDNVVKLKITMKEEGLEWNAIDEKDGSTTKKLLPE